MFSPRHKNRKEKIPSDCIICATRPALYLTQILVYQSTFHCYHSVPPSRPHFRPSRLLKLLTIICNMIIVYGIFNDLIQILENFTGKHVLIFIELMYFVVAAFYNFTFLFKNDIKLKESHGLITLINNKLKFEVAVILTKKAAKRLHTISLYVTLGYLLEDLIMYSAGLMLDNVDHQLFIRMSVIEVLIFCNVSLALYCIQALFIYESIFDRCFDEIEQHLLGLTNITSTHKFLDKLQKLQRLYMSLKRNFQLNEDFLQPEILICYSIFLCLLLIGYCYYVVIFFLGEVPLSKFDIHLLIKSAAIPLVFSYLCYKVQEISTMGKRILSLLFKCQISKLNYLESAQIDMIIATLTLQKPELKASDMFVVGTGLLASISGTVLTYVLVALQFRALWAPK